MPGLPPKVYAYAQLLTFKTSKKLPPKSTPIIIAGQERSVLYYALLDFVLPTLQKLIDAVLLESTDKRFGRLFDVNEFHKAAFKNSPNVMKGNSLQLDVFSTKNCF